MNVTSSAPGTPRRLVAALAAALASVGASAQSLRLEPSITTNVVASDNASFSDAAQARSDVYVELMPRLSLTWRSAFNRLSFEGGFDALRYLRNSEATTQTAPVARAEWASTLIDQALFLDASARLDRRATSPYAAQSVGLSEDGQVNNAVYRLSPHYRVALSPDWLTHGRSDHVLTRRSGAADHSVGQLSGSAYAEDTLLRVERLPQPLGLGAELQRQRLRYLGADDGNMLGLDAARLSLAYAFNPEWTLTVLGGTERNSFAQRTRNDSDWGLGLRWTPMPRSEWSIEGRRRFFGNGFKASWVHNAAQWAAAVTASREPVTQTNGVRLAPIDGNLAGAFDDYLVRAGYGDAAQRAQLVQDTLETLGLPPTLNEPVTVYNSYPQLGTGGTATLTITGRRTTLGFNVYARQLQKLQRTGPDGADDLLAGLGSLAGDLRQYGAQAGLELRVTPLTTFSATLRASQTRSLSNADQSTDGWATLGLSYRLAPKTRAGLGYQYHRLSSTVRPSAQANSVGVSLNHRF